MSTEILIMVFVAFALGGILKGAIGAGAPVLAVPVMAILIDVPFAVAVFVMPNILSNVVQLWKYQGNLTDWRFAKTFAWAGFIGAALGTVALAGLPSEVLTTSVAVIVLGYAAFRLVQPGWRLDMSIAQKLAAPIGTFAGMLQGAIGLSAPVSISFISAIGLQRDQFIPTMSLFFCLMGVAQLPMQMAFGLMTPDRFVYSLLASIPLVGFLPVGAFLARHISRNVFDRIILLLLTLLALKLLADSLF